MTEIRKALLQSLAEIGERYAAMRFGQVVCMIATHASEDLLPTPDEVDDLGLFQAAQAHYSQLNDADRPRTSLTKERRHLLAVLASTGGDRPELGKWLCELASNAHSNVYDVEDEQLLAALIEQQTVPH